MFDFWYMGYVNILVSFGKNHWQEQCLIVRCHFTEQLIVMSTLNYSVTNFCVFYFQGYIRYDQENKAKDVLEKISAAMGDEIVLNENKLEARVLEGMSEAQQ